MRGSVTPVALTLYFALLSSISIGGLASVLPDIRDYVVAANGGERRRIRQFFRDCPDVAWAELYPDDDPHRVADWRTVDSNRNRACDPGTALRAVLFRLPSLEPLSCRTVAARRAPWPRTGDDRVDHRRWHRDSTRR